MADLIRSLDMPLEVDFVALSSYGQGTESSGEVNVVQGLRTAVKDRDILIIEDIIDTGITLNFLIEYLRCEKPASLKICTLFDKASRRQIPLSIDYLGLSVPDVFVVGYGMDYDEKFRHLPGLYFLEEES
jgi:hypoxanthine phosphoribosyltransferase